MSLTFRSFVLILVLFAASKARADTIHFNDITQWTGTGSSQAALFIDWQDGKDPLVWGYRFDAGPAFTGRQMLLDVVTADSNLYARIESFGFGDAVIGFGHDRDADGFSVTGSDNPPAFDTNGFASEISDNGAPGDSDDSYAEAWNTGFWSYHNAAISDGAWSEAAGGMGDRLLSDGDSDGWSFAFGFPFPAPAPGLGPVTAVPEPGGLAILALLSAITCCRRPTRLPPISHRWRRISALRR